MKGFQLDENGDVLIKETKIQMISKTELLRQRVVTVLGTNKGEWFLNPDEGINFDNLLGKKKDDEIIRNEILDGLQQVDSTFELTSFECEFDKAQRRLVISKGDSVMEDTLSRREHEEFRRTFNEKIESLKAEDKRINARLNALEDASKEIQNLALSVKELATNIKTMCETQKREGERLEALESRDGKMWRKITSYTITAVISIAVGFIFAQIGIS